jgi:sugar phosphate isomerase/epimerase
MMTWRDRLGVDVGGAGLEEALQWAAAHDFHYVDFNADRPPNRLDSWSHERVRAVRAHCERHAIHLGLHTLSGVNVAEFSPYLGEAVDAYLRAHIDLAKRLHCGWIIVHAGFHFSSHIAERQVAALQHLQRAVDYAEQQRVYVLLENLNLEPVDAEVHYLAHTVEECRYYFESIVSPHFGWAFTVNHAHLVPEGIHGFLDAFGVERIGEVRLADNLGDKEVHLLPGAGNIDFPSLFGRLEAAGYQHHYMMAFGTRADLLTGRDYFSACFPDA